MYFNEKDTEYTNFPVLQQKDGQQSRLYISSNEDTGIVYKDGNDASTEATESLENIYGVLRQSAQYLQVPLFGEVEDEER